MKKTPVALLSLALLTSFTGTCHALTRVLIVGDSLSAAYGMPVEYGWVALLDARLRALESDATVINASISGETSAGGVARLPALLEQHRPGIVVIELGGNDGLRGYPVPQLRDNLLQMVRLSRAAGADVLLVGMRILPNYGKRYTEAFHQSFVDLAAQEQVPLVPFLLDGLTVSGEVLQSDGIHPTAAVQPMMLDNVWPTLESLLAARQPQTESDHAATDP